jgi:protoporphyrinogen oxidase
MNRRNFIRISPAVFNLPYFLACNGNRKDELIDLKDIPFEIISDQASGHLLFNKEDFLFSKSLKTKYLIVGGGIAGMSAAVKLKNQDFILCELSDSLGGTAGAINFENQWLCQGAHYDLVYPEYFGEEVLNFLEELEVIRYQKLTANWGFVDKQFLIEPEKEGRTFYNRTIRDDIIPENKEGEAFLNLARGFSKKYKLPTRLIQPQYRELNNLSLQQYLKDKLKLTPELSAGIDYQMLDDFGGTAAEVSALAGLYYYAARPYRTKDTEVFSPPQGNFYFIQKMLEQLDNQAVEKILTNHLISKIEAKKQGFVVEVIDIKNKKKNQIECDKIIYAGQKHALKYVYPADYHLFSNNTYSPWLVYNFVLNNDILETGFWQNEIISQINPTAKAFLGFVDSSAQYPWQTPYRVLTAYFCFPPIYRKNLEAAKFKEMAVYASREICNYLKINPKQYTQSLQHIFVKVMGHAMPIPSPNYLFNDKNQNKSNPNLVYAGVDNARLPLMLEAIDSGLEAVKILNT